MLCGAPEHRLRDTIVSIDDDDDGDDDDDNGDDIGRRWNEKAFIRSNDIRRLHSSAQNNKMQ